MPKVLKASFPEKCIGCELCVYAAQRQRGRAGNNSSPIRIFKNKADHKEFLKFSIDLDPNINDFDIVEIQNTCPTKVFEIVEENIHDFS